MKHIYIYNYIHIYIYIYIYICILYSVDCYIWEKGENMHLQNSTYTTFPGTQFAMKYMRTCVQHSFSLDSTGQRYRWGPCRSYGSIVKQLQIASKFTSLRSSSHCLRSGPLFHFKLPEQWDCSETGRLVKMQ